MTDGHLMDAECIHGNVWFECEVCDELDQAEVCPDCRGAGVFGSGHDLRELEVCPRCQGRGMLLESAHREE